MGACLLRLAEQSKGKGGKSSKLLDDALAVLRAARALDRPLDPNIWLLVRSPSTHTLTSVHIIDYTLLFESLQ